MSLLDTGPLDVDAVPATSARATTTPRAAWRKARLPVLLGAFVVGAAVLQTVLTGHVGANRLDPDAAAPEGARALATLLRAHGVDVRKVDVPSGADDTTVFIPDPFLVNASRPETLSAVAVASEVVVAEAEDAHLTALGVDAKATGVIPERSVDPGCTHPDAVAAGSVYLGGLTYSAGQDAVACYALGGEPAFLELRSPGRRVTLLGSAAFMTNDRLGDDGNAALALRLLARHRTVEWVYPSSLLPASPEEEQSLTDLLPRRLVLAVDELLVAVLLLALWRGRRLGPVVTEPLPVVVRAAETIEGRARLYESAGARDQAANALRAGLRDRLVRVLGLAPDAGRETLVAAVTSRTVKDGPTVDALLYGPPPADDAALVRLADGLDSLDSEVRAQ